jgi:DNA-binding CsgD family transcriptional regulator
MVDSRSEPFAWRRRAAGRTRLSCPTGKRCDRATSRCCAASAAISPAGLPTGPTAHSPGVAESLEALAGLAAEHESASEAARVFAAAAAIRTSIGLVRWPADQIVYDQDLETVRQLLDEASFATAWAEGAVLTATKATEYCARARGQRRRPASGWPSLTPTETHVVQLLAKGLTNPQIAGRLFISRATLKTHLIHVFTKLGVTTRAQLAAEATRRATR